MRLETGRYVFGRARKPRLFWFYFWRRDLRHSFVSGSWYYQIQTTWSIMFFRFLPPPPHTILGLIFFPIFNFKCASFSLFHIFPLSFQPFFLRLYRLMTYLSLFRMVYNCTSTSNTKVIKAWVLNIHPCCEAAWRGDSLMLFTLLSEPPSWSKWCQNPKREIFIKEARRQVFKRQSLKHQHSIFFPFLLIALYDIKTVTENIKNDKF